MPPLRRGSPVLNHETMWLSESSPLSAGPTTKPTDEAEQPMLNQSLVIWRGHVDERRQRNRLVRSRRAARARPSMTKLRSQARPR